MARKKGNPICHLYRAEISSQLSAENLAMMIELEIPNAKIISIRKK
jgi:hypothetical protein